MRTTCFLLLLVGGFGATGCSLAGRATHVVVSRAARSIEEHAERKRNQRWAEEVWSQLLTSSEGQAYSDDYADGFKEGFAEYLYQGGSGEPPPLPPGRYRKMRYQTPQGYRAIEEWFAGYRHGAGSARDGGYRRWITGPSSLLAGQPGPPPPIGFVPSAPQPQGPATPLWTGPAGAEPPKPPDEDGAIPRVRLKARPAERSEEELPTPRPATEAIR